MKRLILCAVLLVLPTLASASPIPSGVFLTLENHPDGNIAPPPYGFRADGLDGDLDHEFTYDFSHAVSNMTLFYDAGAGTIDISGVTFGGEDIGGAYAGGGSLWALNFSFSGVVDLGDTLEVAPGGGNVGTLENLVTHEVFALEDYAGSHSYTFRCEEEHRGVGPACSGWANHSGASGHVKSTDWLFVVATPIPEPSSVTLFGFGALAVGASLRRRA
jgi:hypothetical protein